MFDSNLANRIKNLFSQSKNRQFKSIEIVRELHLKKHKRRDLEDTLRLMKKKRLISGKNKRYFALEDAIIKEFSGKFDARSLAKNKSFAFVIQEGKDIYVSAEDVLNAYHGDEVKVAIKYEGKDYLHGYITSIIKRARDHVVGKLISYRSRSYLVPDNSVLHTEFLVLDKADAHPGEKVLCRITNWGNPEKRQIPGCKVVKVLGKAGDPEVEILSVICDYGLPLEFPPKVINQALAIDSEISATEIQRRSDLRKLYTITIDPASAKDYDDAISLEKTSNGFRLYVHIADVSHYVTPGTALFEEALKRGNSYYFPRKVIPMLPQQLSNGICSLRPQEDKLTISVITDYSSEGDITYQEATESIIRSDKRLCYEEVDDYLENRKHELDPETCQLVDRMQSLSKILQNNRIKRGYLSLSLPETEFIFDDEGHVTDLVRSAETESHEMIENFMLSANEYIARRLGKSATIYRIHEAPKPEHIEDLQRLANVHEFKFDLSHTLNKAFQNALESLDTPDRHRVFDRQILRHMKKARYDTVNRGHFGLALEHYTHFTSPIRRLSDLVIHLQLKKQLNGKSNSAPIFSKAQLQNMAEIATEKELIADNSERDVEIKNKLLFMKNKVGQKFSALVIAIKASALIVELDQYPVRGVVPLSSITDDYYEFHPYYDILLGTRKAQSIRLADRFDVILSRVDDDLIFKIMNK